jgi:D-ribose pyranose/furanose isomerase RbsD
MLKYIKNSWNIFISNKEIIKRLETRNLILKKQNQELRKENLKYVIRQGELINYANELSVSDKR